MVTAGNCTEDLVFPTLLFILAMGEQHMVELHCNCPYFATQHLRLLMSAKMSINAAVELKGSEIALDFV